MTTRPPARPAAVRRDAIGEVDLAAADVDVVIDDPEQRGILMADDEIASGQVPVLDLDDSVFRRMTLVGEAPIVLRLSTVDLVDCDFANARAPKSRWNDVLVTGSRLTGIDLGESRMHRVRLHRCALAYSAFRGANLERVEFSECDLRGIDFSDATLTSVDFDRCDLDSMVADDATVDRVDVQGSNLGGTDLRGLRGMTMSLSQAIECAERLAVLHGIIVAAEPALSPE